MFDIQLRPLKDAIFNPVCDIVPAFITPFHLTSLAFGSGILCCWAAAHGNNAITLTMWILNRALDCLDGSVARRRNEASDLGGFLDLLGDFIVYSLIPVSIAIHADPSVHTLLVVCMLEISFHINNFVLFFVAALAEKSTKNDKKQSELTSVMMRPALIEGAESGLIFTAMLVFPGQIRILSVLMTALVSVGIAQRSLWTVRALP